MFGPKIPKFFGTQNFWTQNFLRPQVLFGPKICLDPTFFGIKNLFELTLLFIYYLLLPSSGNFIHKWSAGVSATPMWNRKSDILIQVLQLKMSHFGENLTFFVGFSHICEIFKM